MLFRILIFLIGICFFLTSVATAQHRKELYPDGSDKSEGMYAEYTYINLKVGLTKHPKTKFKKKIGEWTCWYPDGNLMRIENYLKDKKGSDLGSVAHGQWKYYDSSEKLIKEDVYEYGRLTSFTLFADGTIDENGDTIRIVRMDTVGNDTVKTYNVLGTSVKKEGIFRDEKLLRTEVSVGNKLVYIETIGTPLSDDDENMVKNSGFEEYKSIPTSTGQLNFCQKDWSNASRGESDYFHKDSPSELCSVPGNKFGYQEANSGSAYAGICIQFSEFLQAQLKSNLVKDQKYCVELYVSLADYSEQTATELGIYLNDKPSLFKPNALIFPQIVLRDSLRLLNLDEWVHLCSSYLAKGDETHIVIGSFEKRPMAIYYIDDVRVVPIDADSECDCKTTITFAETPYDILKKGMVLRMDFVSFDGNTPTLQNSSSIELNNLADLMQQNKTMKVEIHSHMDNTLEPSQAMKISQERAKNVMDFLIKKGIATSRLSSLGFGDTQPVTDNLSEEGRQKNQRIQIRIVDL